MILTRCEPMQVGSASVCDGTSGLFCDELGGDGGDLIGRALFCHAVDDLEIFPAL